MNVRIALLAASIGALAGPRRTAADDAIPRLDAHYEATARRFPVPIAAGRTAAVEQYGEVVILEGDDLIVSEDGSGHLGIFNTNSVNNPAQIGTRFYESYPDRFDELIVFTSFRDYGSPGALAYELQVTQDVEGIGRSRFANGPFFGGAQLYAFVNMKHIDQYQTLDGLPITDPRSLFYPVLGQEFAHRWLSFLTYASASNVRSRAMLGRDTAHWAANLQADGSVMDGNQWRDNGDGSFTIVAKNSGYSPLNLYAMGLLPASAVPPWYLINNPVRVDNGEKLEVADPFVNVGLRVRGTRENIGIAQVVQSLGPRNPPFGAAPKAFRVAFLLVTRPGGIASSVVGKAAQLETVRKNWEATFARYTGGHGTVCTQVSAPCGSPAARITGGMVAEAGPEKNGVIEPGEAIAVTFELKNDGQGVAEGVAVTASAPEVVFPSQAVVLPRIEPDQTARVTVTGTLAADGKRVCGVLLTVRGEARIGENVWRGFVQFVPGARRAYDASFDDGGGWWGANLDGKDTALVDAWEWGAPRGYRSRVGLTYQPDGGADGSRGAWFTGLARGSEESGATRSLGVGRATLWSPRVDLSSALRPRLEYAAWFIALDFGDRSKPPTVAGSDHLILEGSNDGGFWVKLDQVDGQEDLWQRRSIDLARKVEQGQLRLDAPLQFRFRVNRESAGELVEAGVDEFRIVSDTTSCLPPAAPPDPLAADAALPPLGACSAAAHPTAGAAGRLFAALGLGLGLGLRWRRRRRQRAAAG